MALVCCSSKGEIEPEQAARAKIRISICQPGTGQSTRIRAGRPDAYKWRRSRSVRLTLAVHALQLPRARAMYALPHCHTDSALRAGYLRARLTFVSLRKLISFPLLRQRPVNLESQQTSPSPFLLISLSPSFYTLYRQRQPSTWPRPSPSKGTRPQSPRSLSRCTGSCAK